MFIIITIAKLNAMKESKIVVETGSLHDDIKHVRDVNNGGKWEVEIHIENDTDKILIPKISEIEAEMAAADKKNESERIWKEKCEAVDNLWNFLKN